MKNYLLSAILGAVLFACSGSKEATSTVQKNVQPPLIDREIFFGNPEIAGAQLSPDGEYMAFIKPFNEVRNIWVKKIKEPFSAAKPVTASTSRPIPGYFWSRDSKYLLYVQDKAGDENFHVYALNPFGEISEGKDVPEARNLTEVDGIRAVIYRVPKSDPDIMYVGMNDRDPAYHDLYKVRISTGERELVRENKDKITGWTFDLDDNLRMASRTDEVGNTEFLVVEGNDLKKCYSCSILETCYLNRFHKDGKRVYMGTNKGDIDLIQLVLLDVKTGKTQLVEADPENEVDFGGAVFSDRTNDLVATAYSGDKTRIYFRDRQWEADYNWIKSQLPRAEINLGSSTRDETKWLIYANSDTDPGAAYLFDRKTRILSFQYRPRPNLPIEYLAEMQPIRYPSSDGLTIPAYLTLPKGLPATNLPLIVNPHGGPWARDYWGYNSYAQFLANRGYAVLQVNFRGSTGFGKAFLNAGNKEWGEKMQDDLTWGVKHLVAKGIVDAERVGILGGSYGGYATLAGLTFTPDVYAAGVSIVGPSNLLTLLESIPPYWESIRKLFHERMGDPETEEGLALLKSRSPLFSADKIKVPLMVVQGANDPRVKKAESDQIVVAMRELGLPVEYICAPDEGHGFRRPVNNLAFQAAAEKFLALHLGGRYQEDMSEEVAKRLAEITVDIKTVELPKKVDAEVKSAALPKVKHDLEPGTKKYDLVIKVGGQEIPMAVEQTISEKDGYWMVRQSATSMMGNMLDKCKMEKGTLTPVNHWIEQGPMKIKLDYSATKISGTMNVNGADQPVDFDLDHPVFADGPALYETLARLPLDDEYSTVFRVFDVQSQSIKAYTLKVVGQEEVLGRKTFKTDVSSLDGDPGRTTYWFSAEEGQLGLVKMDDVIPEMNGANLIMTLKQ